MSWEITTNFDTRCVSIATDDPRSWWATDTTNGKQCLIVDGAEYRALVDMLTRDERESHTESLDEIRQLEDALSKERARAEDAERQRDEARATARRASDYYDEECSLRDKAVRERDRHAADAVRLQADLLTARRDLHEFSRELEEEREGWESERAGYEGTLRAMDDVDASLRNEIRELKDLVVAQSRRLLELEGEA
ncbi:hypothetical protein ACFRNT_11495 [Streptomyces sp. NPDC056697]|uniref:hypothetical protein n=1 Tax=Streptomyces sp. NPDC056697 TaxID=3345915 RepID=UPI0036AA2222